MKKIYFLLFTLLISTVSFGQLVINEIDADTPGTDAAEFLELKWTPNTSLNGYIVVFFNGSNDLSYATVDLAGKTTDANGFFILANESLATGSDIVLPAGGSGFIQNGADAVAIYQATAATFPDGSTTSMTNLIDALVYGTADSDDVELLTGLGETVQYDESANGASATESVQRKTDGTYETKTPTFRASNDSAVCELSLTTTSATCDASTSGTDTYTATVDFTGGGTSTYTVTASSGTVSGDSPSSVASGTITVTGLSEGTNLTLTVTNGGLCDLSSTVNSPTCEPTQSLPIYENFNYGSSTGDLTAVSGGNWTNHSGTGAVGYATTSLSMAGYSSSGIGGSATIDAALGEDVNRAFTPQTTGTIYFSALMNLSAVSSGGSYFFHLKNETTGFYGRVGAKDDGSGNVLFGIGATSSTLVYGTTPYSLNTTYLVVGTYNLDSGVSNLYVMTSPSATEPTTPEATDTGSTGNTVVAVALRQGSGTPSGVIDGINVATSWGSVLSTNEFNETAKFKIYPNPTSVGYVNITSNTADAMSVKVFDVLGKQVLNQTVSNNRLNVASLKSGIYIMKISQNDATITKKLVIK
ncbi:MAG: T9SS type A sorting domain-containing protein [Gelidibacter sp.]